jgi:hypothetical protein
MLPSIGGIHANVYLDIHVTVYSGINANICMSVHASDYMSIHAKMVYHNFLNQKNDFKINFLKSPSVTFSENSLR